MISDQQTETLQAALSDEHADEIERRMLDCLRENGPEIRQLVNEYLNAAPNSDTRRAIDRTVERFVGFELRVFLQEVLQEVTECTE